MPIRIRFLVAGLVQGVNFRNFAKKQATALGVTGFVQNDSGETVSGEAQGDESKVKTFVQELQQGPRAARVDKVEESAIEEKEGETNFTVKY